MTTFARLREDGLGRHDAIHAVGSVLIGHLNAAMSKETAGASADPNERYFEELKSLTRASWERETR